MTNNPSGCKGVDVNCCSNKLPTRLKATITSTDCGCLAGGETHPLIYNPVTDYWETNEFNCVASDYFRFKSNCSLHYSCDGGDDIADVISQTCDPLSMTFKATQNVGGCCGSAFKYFTIVVD